MTDIQQVPQHPLERFNNMAERITLPGSGIEVVVRRGDIQALNADATRYALSTPAMQEVAQAWANEAGKAAEEPGTIPRPRPAITPAEALELQRAIEAALLRSVVVAPTLDELTGLYGGNDQQADLGMGPDYRVLLEAVNRLNPADQKEQAKSPSAAVSALERGDTEQHGGEIRETPTRTGDAEVRDPGDGDSV